jgi:hypothetical protein
VVQKNHLMLHFLKLRLVVNDLHIYNLSRNKPVLVTIPATPAHIVVTDGFHITKPIRLTWHRGIDYFHVTCAIDNDLLGGGFIFMIMLFAMGATSGLFVLQLLSMFPIVYILYLYYINREEFIRLRPVPLNAGAV